MITVNGVKTYTSKELTEGSIVRSEKAQKEWDAVLKDFANRMELEGVKVLIKNTKECLKEDTLTDAQRKTLLEALKQLKGVERQLQELLKG